MPTYHSPPPRVLLVEDDHTHREFISTILESCGCHVTIAYNGKDALARIMAMPYNMILMDVEMPEMNGLETARVLRDLMRHGEIEHAPIIAITARREPEMEKYCREAGMVDFIPKDIWRPKWEPLIREKLLHWVNGKELVEGKQA